MMISPVPIIYKLINYRVESHKLGHFVHYYIRYKKFRLEITDSESKKCIYTWIQFKYLVEKRSYTTQEVGGLMIRSKYDWNHRSMSELSESTLLYFDLKFSDLEFALSILDRDSKISSILRK
jgi:hypothetical protein